MLFEKLEMIPNLDYKMMEKVRYRVNHLIKPQGSLGKLEDIVVQLSGITGEMYPMTDKKSILVMCSDHGVCEEHVASAPQTVTLQQTKNIPRGLTGVGSLAKQSGTEVISIDVGVKVDIDDPYVINKKVMYGTNNMTKGPAMSREQAIQAIEVGIEACESAKKRGANIIGTGEMGIGNTTPSTAIISVFSGIDPFEITGIGANFPIEKISHKAAVIKKAIRVNQPDKRDALDVLSKVGGLDIAAMAGVMIGGAANQIPVVVDGFICTAAAIIACELEPKVRSFLIPSHYSKEKGAQIASDYLHFDPFLDLNLRLGEGSGSVLAFSLIESACHMNKEMITFDEANMGIV